MDGFIRAVCRLSLLLLGAGAILLCALAVLLLAVPGQLAEALRLGGAALCLLLSALMAGALLRILFAKR